MTQGVANIRTAKANYSSSMAAQRLASASLLFNLRSAFANVYFAQQSLEMTRRIEEIQKKNAEEVVLRYQSGNEYKGNMMNADAQDLVQKVDTAQAVRSLRAAVKQLDQYLGLDSFDIVVVTGTLAAAAPPNFPGNMAHRASWRTAPTSRRRRPRSRARRPASPPRRRRCSRTSPSTTPRFREGGTEFPDSAPTSGPPAPR